jgi:hypothetical protein
MLVLVLLILILLETSQLTFRAWHDEFQVPRALTLNTYLAS